MKTMRVFQFLLVSSLVATVAQGDDKVCPPIRYPLTSVVVKVETNGQDGLRSMVFFGDGRGQIVERKRGGTDVTREFKVSSDDIVALITRIQGAYFFDAPDRYDEPRSAHLQDPTTVETGWVSNCGGAFTTISVKLGECTKDTIFQTAPPELGRLTTFIQELGNSRVATP
jgi:hypothetical protein